MKVNYYKLQIIVRKQIMTPSELSSDNENHYGILIKRDLFYKMTYFYNTK